MLEKVTLDGKAFWVDGELARALAEEEKDRARRFNEHSQELGELRKMKREWDLLQQTDNH
jgi:hypothetical protein